jgi:hypothetical protein
VVVVEVVVVVGRTPIPRIVSTILRFPEATSSLRNTTMGWGSSARRRHPSSGRLYDVIYPIASASLVREGKLAPKL